MLSSRRQKIFKKNQEEGFLFGKRFLQEELNFMNDNSKEWLQVAVYDIDTLTEMEVRKSHNIDRILSELLIPYPEISTISHNILSIHAYLPKLIYPYGDEIVFDEAISLLAPFNNSVDVLTRYL